MRFILLLMLFISGSASSASPLTKQFVNIFAAQVPVAFTIIEDEENPDYFGGASFTEHEFEISIGKNLETALGKDATALVLCHELGHLMGGAPKKPNSWASTEAQADYFASSKCIQKYLSFVRLEKPQNSNLYLKNQCEKKYLSDQDARVCIRAGEAAYNLFDQIWKFIGVVELPRAELGKASELDSALDPSRYPSLQCRLNTMVAGVIGDPRPLCR